MAAATFQDTLSGLPGVVCEANDAVSAYIAHLNYACPYKTVGKIENVGRPMWKFLPKDIDLGDPTCRLPDAQMPCVHWSLSFELL